MIISALVCITNPYKRQDPIDECLASVLPWADEIIVVDGGTEDIPSNPKIQVIKYPWPEDWSWEELPKHLNAGLESASGNWTIRIDSDYIFKNYTHGDIERELLSVGDKKAATFQKFSAVLKNKFYQKGPTLMALNGETDLCFGRARDKVTDLCVPIKEAESFDHLGVPTGLSLLPEEIGKTHIEFFNYDYTFKTKDFTQKEFFKFSMAYKKYFGHTNWGNTEEESFAKFIEMMTGRLKRCVYTFSDTMQPSFIQYKLVSMTPEQFGYNGWGMI